MYDKYSNEIGVYLNILEGLGIKNEKKLSSLGRTFSHILKDIELEKADFQPFDIPKENIPKEVPTKKFNIFEIQEDFLL